ncbi:MAG: LysR family transcriptional regulator [Segniliparus sp.]|uniref:LysR family transcriptional regulator n=1 Tax=Segniliparus sp. TaxID=2804064 RepID=UPI003F3CD7B1
MGLLNLDVHDLRCFLAVAERLSFTRAARDLHTSTSPLSRRIRDMEHTLGVKLFLRDTRSVELTFTGSALLPIARDIVEKFDEIPYALEKSSAFISSSDTARPRAFSHTPGCVKTHWP